VGTSNGGTTSDGYSVKIQLAVLRI
jgi:hypothetical protein